MKKVNVFFASCFLVIMIAAIWAVVFYDNPHQIITAILSAFMSFVLLTDKADFQIKEEEEK